jgi:putative transposase
MRSHEYGPQSNNLFSIVRGFKGATTSMVNKFLKNDSVESIWQSRFHERILWDEVDLYAVREYINNNPENWENDKNFK